MMSFFDTESFEAFQKYYWQIICPEVLCCSQFGVFGENIIANNIAM